ncbi:hypothetical protein [Clavibacter michiganensis]|uniref:hypothetical protein n=1 Tax=Clavibacter michiganensis TaxID=28447 RepID=UPI000A3C63AE|nr:hypothetical protein [Clavibacter michiganensis]
MDPLPPVSSPSAEPAAGGRGLAVAATAIGVAALAWLLLAGRDPVVLCLAVVAGILGVRALRRSVGRGFAVAGLAAAGIALVVGVLVPLVFPAPVFAPPGYGEGPSGDASEGTGTGEARGSEPEDPAPLGTTVTGEGDDGPEWRVTIGTPSFHMTAAVLDSIAVNPPPDPGMDYAVLPLAVTREAADPGVAVDEISVDYVAEDGTFCAPERYVIAPGADAHAGPLEQGESASVVLVIQVPTGDAGGGTWSVTPGPTSDTSWFVAER